MKSKVIAIYGSARTQPADEVYTVTEVVGSQLAQQGYEVMTGGYGGVMEAASKGAKEAGGRVHGITVNVLGLRDEIAVNQWVTDNVDYATLEERIEHLVNHADGYIVMPGGIGTMQELIEVWQYMRMGKLSRRPLLVYAPYWKPIITPMLDGGNIDQLDLDFIQYFDQPSQVVPLIRSVTSEQSA